jgi:hypothetical protein
VADLGSDFSGILDIDPALTVVSGTRCLAEALARRLTTPKGRLLGDPDYGHDLRQYLNAAIVDTAQIANAIEIECLKDERVQGVTASVTFDAATQTITASIIVKISDDESFPFTLAVGEASAAITLEAA